MYLEAASMALQLFSAFGQNRVEKAKVRAENTINAANVWAGNLMRGANNELAAKRGALARYNQSENNRRVAKETGSQLEAAAVNYRRQRDERDRGSLEQQIAFSEQAGVQAAAAASSGLIGGVADMVAGTVALRRSRIEQAAATTAEAASFDTARQKSNILAAGLSSMDSSSIIDDIDYGIDVYAPKALPSATNVVLGVAAKNMGNLGTLASGLKPKFSFNSPVESYYGVV